MAKSSNQKGKLLYLLRFFMERTDEEHPVTMPQIIAELAAGDIHADRKTVYSDIEELQRFGFDIIKEPAGRVTHYYMGSREFELAELKLLVDSVQSSRFITERKSRKLIHKLEHLVSNYEAAKLQRQVYVTGRIKADNEGILYNVDLIHSAIAGNVKIKFQYFQWNVKKEKELRHQGKMYQVSPWALSWDNENYYLIGYDSDASQIRHYRVDKMLRLVLTEEAREGEECFGEFDMAAYSSKLFGMFSGTEQSVRLEFENRLAGVVIDRFGQDVTFFRRDSEHFEIVVKVVVSSQFFGWLFALGSGVRILAPDEVRKQLQKELTKLLEQY